MTELGDYPGDAAKPQRATTGFWVGLVDALLVWSFGVLLASVAHALLHYVLFIEQLMRSIL
jgi:hypothetical protein